MTLRTAKRNPLCRLPQPGSALRWALLGLAALAGPAVFHGRSQTAVPHAGDTAPYEISHPPVQNPRGDRVPHGTFFWTSDRCAACHNNLITPSGENVSIDEQWRASVMANSSRDPYWQGSLRRETIDHPESSQAIQNDCSTCHMPAQRMPDRDAGRNTDVFKRFPLDQFPNGDKAAADGVTCAVCHQIDAGDLGTQASYSGNMKFSPPIDRYLRVEYGPYEIERGHQTVMHASTATYIPMQGMHIRDAALCGSCHTLYTKALGPHGEDIGTLPEQMPFLEWQHSSYNDTEKTCQYCHMPEVKEPVAITALYGQPRDGMHRHVFVGGNVILLQFLQQHRNDLATFALPKELDANLERTTDFLKTQSAAVKINEIQQTARGLAIDVHIENHGGHKLPTAFPSRRVWLHVRITDTAGHTVFESGALNPDGSIVGNDNDADPSKYEPHYTEITQPDQVEIYEPILGDSQGHVTTGLLTAVGYLKDNRILPEGFDKATAVHDIAVIGRAAQDPNFNGDGSTVRYLVSGAAGPGPYTIQVELWYEPIGFRWAHNLAPYNAPEPQRVVGYYNQTGSASAVLLAHTEATH